MNPIPLFVIPNPEWQNVPGRVGLRCFRSGKILVSFDRAPSGTRPYATPIVGVEMNTAFDRAAVVFRGENGSWCGGATHMVLPALCEDLVAAAAKALAGALDAEVIDADDFLGEVSHLPSDLGERLVPAFEWAVAHIVANG